MALAFIVSYPIQYRQENGTSRYSVAPKPRHSPGNPSVFITARRAGRTCCEEARCEEARCEEARCEEARCEEARCEEARCE